MSRTFEDRARATELLTHSLRLAALAMLAGTVTACGASTGQAHIPATVQPTIGQPANGAQCQEVDGRADRRCTPGVTNADVTQATIGATICQSGWTATVRPPASYTNKLKVEQIAQYGYSDTKVADYEEDHLIPLELGGNPSDPHNLWPQPHYGSRKSADKDQVENQLKTAVCTGSMTLDAARQQILADWTH